MSVQHRVFCLHRRGLALLAFLALVVVGCGQTTSLADSDDFQHGAGVNAEAVVSTPPLAPDQPVTAMPLPTSLPPKRAIYVVDPNDQGLLSSIFKIDPDTSRIVWTLQTRLRPEAVLSSDGQRLYVADSYRRQVTRGEQRDALSLYDTDDGNVLIDDVSIQGRLLYRGWPSSSHPHLFLSDDERQLYVGKYGDPDLHQLRLSVFDAATLQPLQDGVWPSCGYRIQTLPDRWLCANTQALSDPSSSAVTFSLDAVNPGSGAVVETLLSIPDFPGGSMALTSDGTLLYVVTPNAAVTVVDVQNRLTLETKPLEAVAGWQVASHVALAPNGDRLYVGFDTGRDENAVFTDAVIVYDTTTWAHITTIFLPSSINHFALSAAGDQLYVVSPLARSLAIYRTDTYDQAAVMQDLGGTPSHILVSPTAH